MAAPCSQWIARSPVRRRITAGRSTRSLERMASNDREAMDAALKELVVPVLREKGFKGSLPHFRRVKPDAIDLITFQFDKWGGGFVVEISKCPPDGFTMAWGERISPSKVTAHHLNPDQRKRIQPRDGAGTDSWFRFDGWLPSASLRAKRAAHEFLKCFGKAEGIMRSNIALERSCERCGRAVLAIDCVLAGAETHHGRPLNRIVRWHLTAT